MMRILWKIRGMKKKGIRIKRWKKIRMLVIIRRKIGNKGIIGVKDNE
jgi:hypothetical protein